MNILIYGSRGWIGSQFVEIFKNNNLDFIVNVRPLLLYNLFSYNYTLKLLYNI